jgi:hypothetical protein
MWVGNAVAFPWREARRFDLVVGLCYLTFLTPKLCKRVSKKSDFPSSQVLLVRARVYLLYSNMLRHCPADICRERTLPLTLKGPPREPG